jgi:hypothetical protein
MLTLGKILRERFASTLSQISATGETMIRIGEVLSSYSGI